MGVGGRGGRGQGIAWEFVECSSLWCAGGTGGGGGGGWVGGGGVLTWMSMSNSIARISDDSFV